MKEKVMLQYSLTKTPVKKTLRVWVEKKGKRIELNPEQFTLKGNTLTLKSNLKRK